jgi:hypothetical protein
MMWRGEGGWGLGKAYARMYNPQTVETVTGEAVSIDQFRPGKGMYYGIYILVKTDKETVPVHLGPSWYIEHQNVKLAINRRTRAMSASPS